MEMTIRFIIIALFSSSAAILYYAYRKNPWAYQLPGLIIWCLHVILFTTFAILRVVGLIEIDYRYMNIWSNVVRIHAGIVMLATALYYAKKEIIF
jgi:hypothetical protein